MKSIVYILLLALSPLVAVAAEKYQAGEEYFVLRNPVDLVASPGKVVVEELFWYGCPACYSMEPLLKTWHKSRQDAVALLHLPAVWDDRTRLHARMFYTAQTLDALENMHSAFFADLHQNRGVLRTDKQVQKLFAANGIGAQRFQKTFRSFEVELLLKKGLRRARRYENRGTPEVVVNGRYRISVRSAGSMEKMLQVVDYLVRLEEERLDADTASAFAPSAAPAGSA